MNFEEIFWSATIDELKRGYVYLEDKEEYVCLCCGDKYEAGCIYNEDNKLMDAKKTMETHIVKIHDSVFSYLVDMDKKYTGLTTTQKELIKMFYDGISDKEIVKKNGGSPSTIRNQRFTLREKAKQAKIFMSLMDLLEEKKSGNTDSKLITIHRSATSVDDRYAITEGERKEFLDKYFDGDILLNFPKKQKRIIVVLQQITAKFERNKKYSEKEVNEILKAIYSDYVTIRRYLIEYGFMERTRDCHEYWLKN